ncbi:hypothetical protein RT717_01045 [Imperialibacter roseus]|uniref:Uncharacterized protein n=1 Tax=Imperialibacter roseus TaxID=1324217 RepID=A0ABZ0IU33_9BACT|nr:hypothetical protein [Imperialibacter roseus]WOK07206.1 hypothetical protein RT717_01045 [Imperialibacter roseus]
MDALFFASVTAWAVRIITNYQRPQDSNSPLTQRAEILTIKRLVDEEISQNRANENDLTLEPPAIRLKQLRFWKLYLKTKKAIDIDRTTKDSLDDHANEEKALSDEMQIVLTEFNSLIPEEYEGEIESPEYTDQQMYARSHYCELRIAEKTRGL